MSTGFDSAQAATYDDRVGRMIAGYEVMHRLVDVCLSSEIPEQANVLMVGAGTGAEVLECGLRHPGWTLTVVEPSKDMSALAREKIKAKGLEQRVHWHAGTLDTLDVHQTFDAATLLLVLHFLNNDGEKLEMLTGISELLSPGGPFLLTSFVGDPQTTRTKKLYEFSKAWAVAHGLDAQDVATRFSLSRKDIFLVPEEKVKSLLRDSGFIDVQRLFQCFALTGWVARTQR